MSMQTQVTAGEQFDVIYYHDYVADNRRIYMQYFQGS